jgi:hypothetical protein
VGGLTLKDIEPALGPDDQPAWEPSSEVARWFEGKGLDQLELVESGGRFLYPDTLKRKVMKEGQEEAIKVLIRVPSTRDRVLARADALQWAKELCGKSAPDKLTVDAVRAVVGPIYWEHIDNICLLSHCVMTWEEPHGRYAYPDILDAHHPSSALYDALERLDWWAGREDPRMTELDEDVVVEVAAAIARCGNTGPLLAIDGLARDSCVITMARLLSSSRTPKSSSPSPATSTEG